MLGLAKPVLQTAMRGILPEPIRTRRWKRSFNEVYSAGLLHHLSRLEAMVRGSRIGELDIFDRERLVQAMRQHAFGIGSVLAGGRLHSALALIAWVDHLPEALRSPPDRPSDPYAIAAPAAR
jgi:asparagine synthase (glutamine-hydrolysing)